MGTTTSQEVSQDNYEKVQQLLKERSSEGGKIIEINVGGTVFTTLQNTIDKQKGTFFYQILDPDNNLKDYNDRVFLDRPPVLFGIILDGLRSGQLILPENSRLFADLEKEIEYYGLYSVFKDQMIKGRFYGSTLLQMSDETMLNKWVKNTTKDWKLIYKATKDGFKSNNFKSKCQGKSNTFVIM